MMTITWRIAPGEADPVTLNTELGAALNPRTWIGRHNAAQLVVDYDDATIQAAEVTAVLTAHLANKAARDAAAAAQAARLQQDAADAATVKGDAALNQFMNMSPADIDAWFAANVTTLAQARTALVLMAKLLNIACRKALR